MNNRPDKIYDEKDDWLTKEKRFERSTSVWDMDDSARVIKERHEAIHQAQKSQERLQEFIPQIRKLPQKKTNSSFVIVFIIIIYVLFILLTLFF